MERNLRYWILIIIILFASVTGCSRHHHHHDGGDANADTATESSEVSDIKETSEALSAVIVSPASDITIAVGQIVSFQGSISGGKDVITCHWSFGGAFSGTAPDSTMQNPIDVSFSIPGTFTITFTAEDESNASSVDTVMITVVPSGTPIAEIVFPSAHTVIIAGQSVNFQGSVSNRTGDINSHWSFSGAASDSALLNPGLVTFSTPGSYIVTFTVTDSYGHMSSDTVTITVAQNNTVPVAAITSPDTDMSILTGQSVTFQGSVRGGDGMITYTWSFGGAAPDSSLQNPGAITFPTQGSYTVVFTARDQNGDTSSDTVSVTVSWNNTVPVAVITSPATDTNILAGQSATFQGTVSGGDGVITYTWSFDGVAQDSDLQNPGAITFPTPGNYTVVFTARDQDGDTSSDSVSVTVSSNNTVPVAVITSPATDTTILAGQSVTFQGTVSGGGGVITFAWSFGSAALDSDLQNPGTVVFPNLGSYTVVFTVRDQDGETSSDSVIITVEQDTSPVATITSPSEDISVTAGQALLFQGYVEGGNGRLSYRWSFSGGAADSRVKDPGNVYFMMAGMYTATFTVTDSDGDTGSDTVTITVTPAASSWISIVAGYSHTAALKADGSIWAWGNNNSGQLGNGTLVEEPTPVRMGNSYDWRTIILGYYHTLSLKRDGSLWAWGENGNGQLGNGTLNDVTVPEQIGSDVDWIEVDAGFFHTLALKADGSLWAWGYNLKGQLGDGTNINRQTPTRIGNDNDWIAVSAGAYHSVARKSDGSLWAWGYNNNGQLGDGTRLDKNIPTRIGNDTDWIAVHTKLSHAMAIKSDGSLWAWGNNSSGQLGDGTRTNKLTPTRIGSEMNWAEVSVGSYHTIALKNDRSVWVWGSNVYGQLGDGTNIDCLIPLRLDGTFDWVSLAAGIYYSAAFKSDGTLWTWGNNDLGQLGDGTKISRNIPTLIAGD